MRPDQDEGLTLTALLDVLEEPPLEPPAPQPVSRPAPEAPTATPRRPSLAAAAAPRIESAAREAATAVGAVVLLVLVPLAVLAVVTAERTAKAVAAADLPARGRSVANRIPGWADGLESRSQRAAQWVLGPQGIWTGRSPRGSAL